MEQSTFSYKLRASAELIDINPLARGAVLLLTLYKPSRQTREALQKLKVGEMISGIEIIQEVGEEHRSDVLQSNFEFMAFFPDVMHRKTLFQLLIKDTSLVNDQ